MRANSKEEKTKKREKQMEGGREAGVQDAMYVYVIWM